MLLPTLPIVAFLAIASPATARPEALQYDGASHNGQCTQLTLPVAVNATAYDFGVPPVTNRYEVTQWAVSFDTWSTPPSPLSIKANVTVEQTFNVHARLCMPRHGAKKNILHLATHGVSFDDRYWDVSTDPQQYSYVYNTLEAGYSILTYDRLTTGESDKPDGYITCQATVQLEVLRGITEMARSGEMFDHIRSPFSGQRPSFDSIVHVGHSYGSFLTSALLMNYPELSDAAILTGYIPTDHTTLGVTGFGMDFPRDNDPARFGDRPDGYIVPARDIDVQTNFFSAKTNASLGIGGFDAPLLQLANDTKQPGTVGEFESVPLLLIPGAASGFTGPLQFVEAEFDFAVCDGDCHDWNQTLIDLTYPDVGALEIYLQPGTGHGLTMHRNASVAYKKTFDFLGRNGF